MINKRLEILVNKYLDNDLTENEQKELEKLTENENNREYLDSMKNMIDDVENITSEEKEIDLTDSILSEIKQSQKVSLTAKMSEWFEEIFNGGRLGYGISFAMGSLLIGIILFFQHPDQSVNDEFLTGTLYDRNFDETFFLEREPINGSIKVQYNDGVVLLDISLSSEKTVDCKINFDQNIFALYGIKNIDKNTKSNFSSTVNTVALSNLEAEHYLVFLRVKKNVESKINAVFSDGITDIENISININN